MTTPTYREADASELDSILAVQREAFQRVAHELGIPTTNLPPLTETDAELAQMLESGTRFFVAVEDGRVIGSVRATPEDDLVHVGRLVVIGSHVRLGVGTRLMALLEASFPLSAAFRLFTGVDAHAPLALYRGLGYVETQLDTTGPVELVWLEKRR